MPRKRREHVYGPYPEQLVGGLRYRVVYLDAAGGRSVESFAGEGASEQAEKRAAYLRSLIQGRSVSDALDEYLADCKDRGLRARSLETTTIRLRSLLGINEKKGLNGGALSELRPAVAAKLFETWRAKPGRSVDYVRGTVGQARTWAKWCIEERGWIKVDPFAGLQPKGRRKRGKPQHTIDEARKFYAFLLAVAAQPIDAAAMKRRRWDHAVSRRQGAVAVLTAQLLGPRATEVIDRQCRELDDGGRILWITDSKTEAGKRRLMVPDELQPLLRELVAARPGDALIFSGRRRRWLLRQCKALCEECGVPVVTPQGLRGGHASLATEAGTSPLEVSRALGHAGTAVTERHYTTPDAKAAGRQERTMKVIMGGKK